MKLNRKTLFTLSLTVIILIFGINWFVNYADWQSTRALALGLERPYLALFIVIAILNALIYPLPFKITTKNLSYARAFVIRQSSFAIANTLPAGGTIGVAIIYVMMRAFRISSVASFATISISGVFNVMMTLGMPMFSLILLALSGQNSSRLVLPAIIAGILLIIMISGFVGILRSAAFGKTVENFFARVMQVFKSERRISFTKFRIATYEILKEKWVRLLAISIAIQLFMFSALPVALFGLEQNIGFFEILVAFAFARLVTLVPVTPGGIGTTDGLLLALLIGFGATLPAATASILIWRTVYYLPQVVLGLVSVIFWQLKINR